MSFSEEQQFPIYMQARMYLPTYGRFAQPDPAYDHSEDALNLYSYCSNNPVTRTDPDGMRDISGGGGGSGHDTHYLYELNPNELGVIPGVTYEIIQGTGVGNYSPMTPSAPGTPEKSAAESASQENVAGEAQHSTIGVSENEMALMRYWAKHQLGELSQLLDIEIAVVMIQNDKTNNVSFLVNAGNSESVTRPSTPSGWSLLLASHSHPKLPMTFNEACKMLGTGIAPSGIVGSESNGKGDIINMLNSKAPSLLLNSKRDWIRMGPGGNTPSSIDIAKLSSDRKSWVPSSTKQLQIESENYLSYLYNLSK